MQSLVRELDETTDADRSVVVDLTKVGFLDSSILNALLKARDQALSRQEGSFVLVAPPGSFASRVLALVVGTLIPTYADLDAAVASVTVPRS